MRPLFPDASDKLFVMMGIEPPAFWSEDNIELAHCEILIGQIDSSVKPTPLFNKITKNK